MFRSFAVACLGLLALIPAASFAQSNAALQTGASMAAADARDWARARQLAAAAGDPAAMELYQWRLLSAGNGTWPAYRDFVARNSDWPNLTRIRREGERLIPPGTPLSEIDVYFAFGAPQTGTGARRRAEALRAEGRLGEADAQIIETWRSMAMTAEETAIFRANYGSLLTPHHEARADAMLWAGETRAAEAMKGLVAGDWNALIEARVRLRRRAAGVDASIEAVPASLRNHPGLAYERFVWRMRRNLYGDSLTLLQTRSGSAASLGEPELWGPRRRLLVRWALRQGRPVEAYNLANQHFLNEGSDYADLEWLAGWIALRQLDEPDRAIAHFTRFIAAVETPISYGRGYYWLGRAQEARGDGAGARASYARGAEHQTSFYGQLAAERIGAPVDPFLTASADGDWRRASFAGRSVARAAQLLSESGDRRRAHWFLTHIASTLNTYEDLAGVAQLADELGRPDAAIRIAKIAARKGHVLRGHYYPLTGLAGFNAGVEPALAMAIGRQESELNPQAISPAGARGLMQLMPATAQRVAGWVGQPYSLARLTGDWRYNATLGQTYLARRQDQFAGSVAMAAAAYNAGAGRVDQWIARYGDPRTGQVDWIDWLETIPFTETRNYVQRVLEGLQVYRSRIAGAPVAFQLKRDALGR